MGKYYTYAYEVSCPFRYKSELVNWASNLFSQNKGHFKKMTKKQLYAIWYNYDKYHVR